MTIDKIFDDAVLVAFTTVSDREISGCYIGDILSLAMSKVKKNDIWITAQCSINTVAVAVLTEAAGVIICEGFKPEEGAAERARQEGIEIFGSCLSAYELSKIIMRNI